MDKWMENGKKLIQQLQPSSPAAHSMLLTLFNINWFYVIYGEVDNGHMNCVTHDKNLANNVIITHIRKNPSLIIHFLADFLYYSINISKKQG